VIAGWDNGQSRPGTRTGGRGPAATARRTHSGYLIVSTFLVRDVWPRLSFAETVIVKAFFDR
jgi:hypothetical protein